MYKKETKLERLLEMCYACAGDEVFEHQDQYGRIGSAVYRVWGARPDMPEVANVLQLGDAKHFDRWANSAEVTVSLQTLIWGNPNWRDVITGLVAAYNYR